MGSSPAENYLVFITLIICHLKEKIMSNLQKKISQGVSGWLLYEFNCNRGDLFNEKYLSFPIGNILNTLTEFQTSTEENHPCSNSNSKGRPLQVDFVILDKYKTKEWKYAIETKWIGKTNISLHSVIWDLIRLQNLFKDFNNIKCYFVLSGFNKKIQHLTRDFNITYNLNNSSKSNLTTVNNNTLKFHLDKLDNKSKNNINAKIKNYIDFTLYSKIVCKPAHVYPNENLNMTFSTYIFEILKPGGTMVYSTL